MKHQRGFTLISAVFVIVVLTLVLAFAVRVSLTQNTTVALASQGSAAFYAAKAGLEWGVYRAASNTAGTVCPSTPGMTVGAFTVTVSCQPSPESSAVLVAHDDPAPRYPMRLIAVASRGVRGSPDYVERRLEATIVVPPASE